MSLAAAVAVSHAGTEMLTGTEEEYFAMRSLQEQLRRYEKDSCGSLPHCMSSPLRLEGGLHLQMTLSV